MYSRAGLVALFLAFLTAFTTAAPVPTTNSASPRTSLSHRTPHSHALGSHTSIAITQTHLNNQILPSVPAADDPLAVRELVSLERRRRNPFAKIRNAFRKVGNGIKRAARKVGNGIKSVARKAIHFVKVNGAKIAKVALKIVATATKMASKVVGYIPGVGKVLSKAMTRASSAADAASNRIHANIGGKLGKAMEGMDEAEKISSYIPREISEGVQFQERDLGVSEFDARDAVYESNSLLDARADFEEWLYERSWDDGEGSNMY